MLLEMDLSNVSQVSNPLIKIDDEEDTHKKQPSLEASQIRLFLVAASIYIKGRRHFLGTRLQNADY